MAREFIVPKQIFTGSGALAEAKTVMKTLGNRALVVTDQVMIHLKNCAMLEAVLSELGISSSIFAEIIGEPTDEMVEAGLGQYYREECDFLIALGGGSQIDIMKAIASLVEDGGDISDYMGKVIDVQVPPMVAIPTTAGTGSEATQFTIITDTKKDIKMLLKGKVLVPTVAIIDPVFTLTVPPEITAATGLDALCHGIEAFTSRKAQAMSDTFALSAVRRIFKYLPIAFKDGQNEEARTEMAIASLEAGVAFNNASVTLIHGMSRPIGALFHVAHGLSNAMLMNVCLTFAAAGATGRFGELGRIIGVAGNEDSDDAAAQGFLQALAALTKELKIPTPKQYGIDKEVFFASIDKMSRDAMDSGSPQNTLRDVTKADLERLYQELW